LRFDRGRQNEYNRAWVARERLQKEKPLSEKPPAPEKVPALRRLTPFQIVLIVLGLVALVFLSIQVARVWNGAGDPVAFRLGPLQVRWYGIILMSGALCGALLGEWEARRRGWNPDHIWNLLLWGLILGVAVSRLWYVVGSPGLARDPLAIIGIVNGRFVGLQGLTIHGALAGAVLAAALYTWAKKLNLLQWLDVGGIGFVLGQAVGRWGNFFNHEAYGQPTTLPWGLLIPQAYRLSPYTDMSLYPAATTRFQPTFLYESLWNLAVCAFLLYLARRYGEKLIPGEIFWLYGMLYGVGRFFLEFLRVDSIYLGAFPAAQIASVGLFVVCAALLAFRRWIWKRQTYGELAAARQAAETTREAPPETRASEEAKGSEP
jgi:phosphatidylglycerol:prolipoprotein diacylglycerol transferase